MVVWSGAQCFQTMIYTQWLLWSSRVVAMQDFESSILIGVENWSTKIVGKHDRSFKSNIFEHGIGRMKCFCD